MNKLRYIQFGEVNVYEIMAATEALYRIAEKTGQELAYTWLPKKSIIMGYSQIIEKELNPRRCEEMGYSITRRISGGGMAFSSGNSQVQYGFIGNLENPQIPLDVTRSYEKVCQMIIHALDEYGLEGEFKPINDVLCNGKKISGSAQSRGNEMLLQNGTLLVDLDVEEMLLCCNIPMEKISDKGIKSVKDRVTDLNRELGEKQSLQEVIAAMRKGYEETFGIELVEDEMNEEEKKLTEELLPKYKDESWIYRYSLGKTRSKGHYETSPEVKELGSDQHD